MPPALRWEVGTEDPFGQHLEEIVAQRLCKKFRVQNTIQMSDKQKEYCGDYYRAMVEPFTDNRSWYRLLRTAESAWRRVFQKFVGLERISVGCCNIVDHPSPTCTYTFVFNHGRSVIEEPDPPFIEDSAVNLAWASCMVMRAAPANVQSLRLSLANMDNFNSFATINRLLGISYKSYSVSHTLKMTRICLTLQGIRGTHGSRNWAGDTGSAAVVRYWKGMLNKAYCLQHLELRNELAVSNELQFSNLERTDLHGTIIDWLLPDLSLPQLRTLRLCDFLLDENLIHKTLSGKWPRLEQIILDDIQLMMRDENGQNLTPEHIAHLQGQLWLDICRKLTEEKQGLRIALNRPVANVYDVVDFRLHPRYVQQIEQLPGVKIDMRGPFGALVKPPKEESDSASAEPMLPNAPTTLV